MLAGGCHLWEVPLQGIWTYSNFSVQSTYQHKILYHFVLMQRTKRLFQWTCTVTHHSICVCSDTEIQASSHLPEVKTIETFKSPALKAVVVAYEMFLLIIVIWLKENLVFWKSGCLGEVVAHGGSTVFYCNWTLVARVSVLERVEQKHITHTSKALSPEEHNIYSYISDTPKLLHWEVSGSNKIVPKFLISYCQI